jgi:hypothetical protein
MRKAGKRRIKMEREIMSVEDIKNRIDDIWFTNGWGDRFPARDSYVMLKAANNEVISYGFDGDNGEKTNNSSEGLLIKIWSTPQQDYWASFSGYDGNGKDIRGKGKGVWDMIGSGRNIYLSVECGQNVTLRLRCKNGTACITYPKDTILYEDDWYKCRKCGLAHRVGVGLSTYMAEHRKCSSCGHPAE